MEWTTAVAIYGALVSTVTAAWNVRTGLRDRPRLRLDLRLRKLIQDTTGKVHLLDAETLKDAHLVISVTNAGRRPITVTTWTGEYLRPEPNRRFFAIVGRDLPKKLDESEELHESTPQFAGPFEAGVKRIFVADSTGQQWTVPRKRLKAVLAEFKRLKKG